jgi:CHAD domain-containing protein
MSFELSPLRSLSREFQRLQRTGLEHAVTLLRESDQDVEQRVHQARRQLKQLRALLRLVAPTLGKAHRARDAEIRRAARALAPARDAAALREALTELLAEQTPEERGRLARQAEELERAFPAVEHDGDAGVAEALAVLEGLAEAPLESEADVLDWSGLLRGFRDTYARARRELRRSLEQPTSKQLHRFRTQVKRHQHQVELLTPLWPKVLGAFRRELSNLGELLGREHDLSRLAAELERADLPVESADMAALIQARRQTLRAEALGLGRRAFAEPARGLAARFEAYLSAWREEATRERPLRSTKGKASALALSEKSERATA